MGLEKNSLTEILPTSFALIIPEVFELRLPFLCNADVFIFSLAIFLSSKVCLDLKKQVERPTLAPAVALKLMAKL